MKLNISESTKNLLYCLVGIVLVVAAFFLGFQQYREENVQLKQQKDSLEKELSQLNEIQINQSDYEEQIKDYNEKVKKLYQEFPPLVQAREQILYASDLEKRYDTMFIQKVSGGEAEYLIGTEGDAMVVYKVPTELECTIRYDQLKDFLIKTTEDGTRKAIDEVVLTTDGTTGELVGQIQLSMYYMTGTDQKYEPAKIEDVTTGTQNLFQNTIDPQEAEDQEQPQEEE